MMILNLLLWKKYTSGPRYWNVPVLVDTGTFLVYQYCLKLWYLRSLDHAGCIQKQTILERKNGLVLSNTRAPVSGTWSTLFPFQVFIIAKFEFKVTTIHYGVWAKCTQLWLLKVELHLRLKLSMFWMPSQNHQLFWKTSILQKMFNIQFLSRIEEPLDLLTLMPLVSFSDNLLCRTLIILQLRTTKTCTILFEVQFLLKES